MRAPTVSLPSSCGGEEPAAIAALGVTAADARHFTAAGDGQGSTVVRLRDSGSCPPPTPLLPSVPPTPRLMMVFFDDCDNYPR